VLADALADRSGGIGGACARYEARLRPWVEAAQRNVRLFMAANRFQLLVREPVLPLAAWPSAGSWKRCCPPADGESRA